MLNVAGGLDLSRIVAPGRRRRDGHIYVEVFEKSRRIRGARHVGRGMVGVELLGDVPRIGLTIEDIVGCECHLTSRLGKKMKIVPTQGTESALYIILTLHHIKDRGRRNKHIYRCFEWLDYKCYYQFSLSSNNNTIIVLNYICRMYGP